MQRAYPTTDTIDNSLLEVEFKNVVDNLPEFMLDLKFLDDEIIELRMIFEQLVAYERL